MLHLPRSASCPVHATGCSSLDSRERKRGNEEEDDEDDSSAQSCTTCSECTPVLHHQRECECSCLHMCLEVLMSRGATHQKTAHPPVLDAQTTPCSRPRAPTIALVVFDMTADAAATPQAAKATLLPTCFTAYVSSSSSFTIPLASPAPLSSKNSDSNIPLSQKTTPTGVPALRASTSPPRGRTPVALNTLPRAGTPADNGAACTRGGNRPCAPRAHQSRRRGGV